MCFLLSAVTGVWSAGQRGNGGECVDMSELDRSLILVCLGDCGLLSLLLARFFAKNQHGEGEDEYLVVQN